LLLISLKITYKILKPVHFLIEESRSILKNLLI